MDICAVPAWKKDFSVISAQPKFRLSAVDISIRWQFVTGAVYSVTKILAQQPKISKRSFLKCPSLTEQYVSPVSAFHSEKTRHLCDGCGDGIGNTKLAKCVSAAINVSGDCKLVDAIEAAKHRVCCERLGALLSTQVE